MLGWCLKTKILPFPTGRYITRKGPHVYLLSCEHISFKAAPFNIARADVNISFMWAKRPQPRAGISRGLLPRQGEGREKEY